MPKATCLSSLKFSFLKLPCSSLICIIDVTLSPPKSNIAIVLHLQLLTLCPGRMGNECRLSRHGQSISAQHSDLCFMPSQYNHVVLNKQQDRHRPNLKCRCKHAVCCSHLLWFHWFAKACTGSSFNESSLVLLQGCCPVECRLKPNPIQRSASTGGI